MVKRKLLYVIVGLGLVVGVAYMGMYAYVWAVPMSDCSWRDRVAAKPNYDILNTKSRLGDDVDFWHDFRTAEITSDSYQSNLESEGLVEKGSKVDSNGNEIGRRGVTVFPNGVARIFWTEGDEFWSVQADSLRLAKAVERQCFAR